MRMELHAEDVVGGGSHPEDAGLPLNPHETETESPTEVTTAAPALLHSSPASATASPVTILHKPTFMRVARKYISPEVLDSQFIPYIDDPDPAFLLITQWIPEAQMDGLWRESSARAAASTLQATPSSVALAPIIESPRSPSETQQQRQLGEDTDDDPLTPTIEKPHHKHHLSEESVGPLTPTKENLSSVIEFTPRPPDSIRSEDEIHPIPATEERGTDQASNIDLASRPPMWELVRQRTVRESELDEFVINDENSDNDSIIGSIMREQRRQQDRNIKKLAWEQRINNHGIFNTFEQAQVLLLHHLQHDLVMSLNKFDSKNKASKAKLKENLHSYLKTLRDYQWTQSLDQVSIAEAQSHSKDLQSTFSDFGDAYKGPYASDLSSLVDIHRNSKTDLLRKLIHQSLPERLALDDPSQTQLRSQLRDLGFAETELPPRPPTSSPLVDGMARFLLALLGGCFLLVPMIAMNFSPSQNVRLGIAAVFVVVFSSFLACSSRASNLEVIGGAAAYSAVLVVFLGSALGSGKMPI